MQLPPTSAQHCGETVLVMSLMSVSCLVGVSAALGQLADFSQHLPAAWQHGAAACSQHLAAAFGQHGPSGQHGPFGQQAGALSPDLAAAWQHGAADCSHHLAPSFGQQAGAGSSCRHMISKSMPNPVKPPADSGQGVAAGGVGFTGAMDGAS